jgi:flagellar hook-basal body complex protein FliE
MSMIPPAGGVASTAGIWSTQTAQSPQPTVPTAPTSPAGTSTSVGDGGFASVLGNAIDSMQSAQSSADSLATQAATGSLTNVSDYMVAAEQANLDTQLTVAVRNNALQAFQQIMGMQL